jgi:hypothetical protein
LERAWSEHAATSPWQWPITSNAADASTVVNATQFRRVISNKNIGDCKKPAENFLRFVNKNTGDEDAAVALAYRSLMHHSLTYGHFWEYIHSFYCGIVRPRVGKRGLKPLRVFLPAGVVNCSEEFDMFITLFGSIRAQAALSYTLERAPWVPSCIGKGCYAHGGTPRELRGKVLLLSNFPLGRERLYPEHHPGFRQAVYDSLGIGQGQPGTILYVRSRHLPTGRSVGREAAVVQALAKWAAAEHPQLNFSAEDVHRLAYAEEVARFADARVMISLWGSSLHNCRYMRPGTLVVELFGALGGKWGDTTLYNNVCSHSCGLQHAPFGVPGAYPVMEQVERGGQTVWSNKGYEHSRDTRVARVDPKALVAFMRRVFPADPCELPDWLSVFREYNQFLSRQPHPLYLLPLIALGKELTEKPLLPQYTTSLWCNRTLP